MKQIAAPWGHDAWAEEWEKFIKAEAWCYKYCDYVDVCPIVGQPYSGRNCQLQVDESNSR